ncbi:hypothetical protein CR513_25908, partial [Mucuna pruriens]
MNKSASFGFIITLTFSSTFSLSTSPSPSHGGLRCCNGVLSIEERRLETKKLKVVGGDRLEYQRTLEDLILSVLATRGEPSPSAIAIFMDGGATEAKSLSNTDPSHAFDLEIELTLRKIRRNKKTIINNGSVDYVLDSNMLHTDILVSSSNTFIELGQMENHDRMLKELATPDVVYQPWCIQYPQLEPAQTFELKSSLIQLLPKFHGLAEEDPYKHLKEFHVAAGNPRRLHQDEGVPILPGWSRKGLAISTASTL